MHSIWNRSRAFCDRFGLDVPILLAPMAGACPPSLSIAVMQAGGMGACGALLMQPDAIATWAEEVRSQSTHPFQINLWIPDPAPHRDAEQETKLREFLGRWGPAVARDAGNATPPDFKSQCEALLEIKPPVVSSVMGIYPPEFVVRLKQAGIAWCANVTTVAEAKVAERAGADLILVQGMEAGGHRGCFVSADAERTLVGLFALLPSVVQAVQVPVVAAGAIADGRGIAAAIVLGADAVAIGTGFLRCPEAKIHPAWSAALVECEPEGTMLTRAFSGRAGRSIATDYVLAAQAPDAPKPAPYPVQRGLTSAMRAFAQQQPDVHRLQAWAGQAASRAKADPAGKLVRNLWDEAQSLLS